MNLIEAWKKANIGQKVYHKTWGSVIRSNLTERLNRFIYKEMGCAGILATDWEIAKEKHKLEFTGVEVTGVIGEQTITDLCAPLPGSKRPTIFTKVTLEWEE